MQWPLKTLPIEEYMEDHEHALYFEAVLELLAEVCFTVHHSPLTASFNRGICHISLVLFRARAGATVL